MASDAQVLVTAALDDNSIKVMRARLESELKGLNAQIQKSTSAGVSQQLRSSASTKDLSNGLSLQNKLTQSLKESTVATSAYSHATDAAGKSVATFGERLGFTTARLAAYLLPAGAIFKISQGFNNAASSVVDLNAELNKLTQILDGNQEHAKRTADQVSKIATQYGQSLEEVLKITNVLAQAGDTFDGEKLSKSVESLSKTKILATFGSIEETTRGAIAALNQFGLSAGDLNHILDISNTLAKKFSVESADIFTAVETGGAAFAAAGGKIDEYAAAVTSLVQLTKLSASTVGTGLNTIALRLIRPDVIKFTDSLTGGKTRDAQGNLKGITERLIEIQKAAKGLNVEEIGKLVDVVSGSRQGKLFVPFLSDRGAETFQKSLQAAKSAPGSVNRDTVIALERIDVLLGSIGANFEKAFLEIAKDSNFHNLVKDLADMSKVLADILKNSAFAIPALIKISAIGLGIAAVRRVPDFVKGLTQSASQNKPGDPTTDDLFNAAIRKQRELNTLNGVTGSVRTESNLANILTSKDRNVFRTIANQNSGQELSFRPNPFGIFPNGVGIGSIPSNPLLGPENRAFDINRVVEGAVRSPPGSILPFANAFTQQFNGLTPFGFNNSSTTLGAFPSKAFGLNSGINNPIDINNVLTRGGLSNIGGLRNPFVTQVTDDFSQRNLPISDRKALRFLSGAEETGNISTFRTKGQGGTSGRELIESKIFANADLARKQEKIIQNRIKLLEANAKIIETENLTEAQWTERLKTEILLLDESKAQLQRINQAGFRLAASLDDLTIANIQAATAAKSPGLISRGISSLGAFTGQGLSKIGGFAKTTGRALLPFVPSIVAGLASAGLDSFASSSDKNIKQLFNNDENNSVVKNLKDQVNKNRFASTTSGTLRGASSGLALGGALALIPGIGIPASIAAIAGSAIAGGTIGNITGRSEGRKNSLGQLFEAAGAARRPEDTSLVISEITKRLSSDNGLSINSPNAGGAFNTAFNTLSLGFGGGSGNKDFQKVLRKQLSTEQGQGLVQSLRQRAISTASTTGLSEGEIRQRFIKEEAERQQGLGLNKKDAFAVAQTFISESFRKADISDSIKKASDSFKEVQNATNKIVESFNRGAVSIEQFLKGTDDKTKSIDLSNRTAGFFESNKQQNIAGLFGQATPSKISDNFAQLIVDGIQEQVRNINPKDVFGQGNVIQSILDKSLGNTFSGPEKATFNDILQIQKATQSASFQNLSNLSGQVIGPESKEAVDAQAATLVDAFFNQAQLSLNTQVGRDQLATVRDRAIELSKTGQFNSPESAVSAAFKEFAELNPVLRRLQAIVGSLNTQLDINFNQYLNEQKVREESLRIFQRSNELSTQRIRLGGSAFGENSATVAGNLFKSIGDTSTGGLIKASKDLQNAQKLQTLPDSVTGLLSQFGIVTESTSNLRKAQDNYNAELLKSNENLSKLRATFEEYTNSIKQTIQSNQNLSVTPVSDRLKAQSNISLLDSFTSGSATQKILRSVQGPEDIGRALAEKRITLQQLDLARSELNPSSGTPGFIQANEIGPLGNQKTGLFPGQTQAQKSALAKTIAGADDGTFKDISDQSIKQGDINQKIHDLEDLQLQQLVDLNKNVSQIIQLLPPRTVGPTSQPSSVFSTTSRGLTPTSQPVSISPSVSSSSVPTFTDRKAAELQSLRDLGDAGHKVLKKHVDDGTSTREFLDVSDVLAQLRKLGDTIRDAKSVADIKFDGNFNFAGFESIGRDTALSAIADGFLNELIKQLRGGSTQEQQLSVRFEAARKALNKK